MKKFLIFYVVGFFLFSGSGQTAGAEQAREVLIADLHGQVTVKQNQEEWKPALAGNVLKEKDEIKTGPGGYAELLMDGGDVARLELKENSYFRINTMGFDKETGEKSTLLDLAIGKVLVHAEKLKSDSKFEVRTPTSTTGVRGTVFEVEVAEDKK